MEDDIKNPITPADWVPENSIIKVIGVGGGGCNAVTYMYNQHIKGCSFIVCNTDGQSLEKSNVPIKIRLGHGLGAGTNPDLGRKSAIEGMELIAEKALDNNTKMLFITAGMGGGTGTGASPVIAKMARERGILTVAVITLPFKSEGQVAMGKAIDGIHELERNVDSLLIINNDKIGQYFGNELIYEAFPKTDEVLATAVKGIIEIIDKNGFINVDFNDVTNMMRNSGMALMGSGIGKGKTRIEDAVKGAFESPLLNDFDLSTAKNYLINITVSNTDQGIRFDELNQIDELISSYTGGANRFKRGLIYDSSVGDEVHITAIATGFDMGRLGDIADINLGNTIVIDPEFTYKAPIMPSAEEETRPVPSGNATIVIKVDPDSDIPVGDFYYDPVERPALSVDYGKDLSQLENNPAINRKKEKRLQNGA